MSSILHIDTSGEHGVVAISANGQLLYSKNLSDSRSQAAEINLLIDEVVQNAGVALHEIDAIAVIGGPGSYTGLRIGLATAKGLCYALDKPLLMHNKLALLAQQELDKHGKTYSFYGSALMAREGEYFFTLYNNEGHCEVEPAHFMAQELIDIINGRASKICLSGLLSKAIIDMLNIEQVQLVENEHIDINFWMRRSFTDSNCNDYVILSTSEPFYLKQVYTHKSSKIN